MNIATAYSVKGNAKEAVLEIKDMLKGMEPKMVVFSHLRFLSLLSSRKKCKELLPGRLYSVAQLPERL